jgi:hypothetical protein
VPPDARQRYQDAITALSAGHYAEGFAAYDARWEAAGIPRPAKTDAAIVGPEWRGSRLTGKRILLHSEQGIGDSIQFLRFVPRVQAMGPEIVLEVRPALRDLVRSLHPSCTVGNGVPQGRYDLHCSLMSLPAVFGTTIDSVPPPAEFHLPAAACERWQGRIPQSGRRNVGLVWTGNAEYSEDARRSMAFERLLPLLKTNKSAHFFSFQLGPYAGSGLKIVDLAPQLTSFVETAAALLQMQLVITVDTALAHLAGSLGLPVWLLLPFAPSWRWMLDRSDSPWYPTMRLFRQTARGDWDSVIRQVTQLLPG